MITLKQAYKIYNLVINEYEALKMEIVNIELKDKFYYEEDLLAHTIAIKNSFESKQEREVVRLIEDKGIKSEYHMMEGENEVVALLHEVGHLLDNVVNGTISNAGYKEYKNTTFYSIKQANMAYRNIPAENFADLFTVDFINKNGKEIWGIMNPDMTPDEIDDWIEMFK